MTENDFFEDVKAVCERPRFYTPTGAFYEAISFLEGLKKRSDVGRKNAHMPFTTLFFHWYADKFAVDRLDVDWVKFREMFSSDSEAFDSLKTLYKEFANSVTK